MRRSEWWAVDERSGTAYSMDDAAGTRLWTRHDLLTQPLIVALRAQPLIQSPHFVDLRFAGVTARYVSDSARLIDDVVSAFAGAVSTLRNSPDILIELDPDVDVDRLHRAVQGARTGVTVREVSADCGDPGASDLPVVPPVQLAPFAGRFCGLHAALLATPRGNVVVCGAQRSGKTTIAVLSARRGLASVLTDELVLVSSSGGAVGVALPIRERTTERRRSYCLEPTEDGAHMVAVDRVVLLASTGATDCRHRVVAELSEALRLIVPHLRPLGGPLGRATDNLLKMLRRAEVWHWQLRPWPRLPEDILTGLARLLGAPP